MTAGHLCALVTQRWDSAVEYVAPSYNTRMTPIPDAIHGQRYISLATFRKSGVPVYTPIWFAENAGKLYFMTNMKLGKCKRIRNNPQVKIAPCTIRGKITGPEFPQPPASCRPKSSPTPGRRSEQNTGFFGYSFFVVRLKLSSKSRPRNGTLRYTLSAAIINPDHYVPIYLL
jgi:hypothetical protein